MGVIKLSDFGASKKILSNFGDHHNITEDNHLIDNTVLNKTFIGSPYWMAPEVIMKSGHGKPADIWSLGCCVIEMLTSKPTWSEHGKDAKTIMKLIASSKEPPKFPGNISKECIQFLNYCFEHEQTKRPTAEELLYHPFVLSKRLKLKNSPKYTF
jgi:serine/threonine protein kinase